MTRSSNAQTFSGVYSEQARKRERHRRHPRTRSLLNSAMSNRIPRRGWTRVTTH